MNEINLDSDVPSFCPFSQGFSPKSKGQLMPILAKKVSLTFWYKTNSLKRCLLLADSIRNLSDSKQRTTQGPEPPGGYLNRELKGV